MNRTINHLGHALKSHGRHFFALDLASYVGKTTVLSRPLRTSQTRTIRSFSTSPTTKTGSKHDQQDHATSFLSPFASNQQLSKRKQFKQITPDRHLVNYLDTHQLGYCAKRKVSPTLILACLILPCTILNYVHNTVLTSGSSSVGKKISITSVVHILVPCFCRYYQQQ